MCHYGSVKGFRTVSVADMLYPMASPTVRTQIRIPKDLYDQLQKAAEESARSFNAEMIIRLESSFRHGISPERTAQAPDAVYLRPFQRWLMEGMRKVVRIEALMGAPSLTRDQKAELARLKEDLKSVLESPEDLSRAQTADKDVPF